MPFVATAYEDLSVGGAAPQFTAAVYLMATCAVIYVDGNSVRFRLDGVTPRAGSGILAEHRSVIHLDSPDQIQRFRPVDEGQGTTLRAQFGHGLDGGFRVLSPSPLAAQGSQLESSRDLCAIRIGLELLIQQFTDDKVDLMSMIDDE